jgi:hypothetical protein
VEKDFSYSAVIALVCGAAFFECTESRQRLLNIPSLVDLFRDSIGLARSAVSRALDDV